MVPQCPLRDGKQVVAGMFLQILMLRSLRRCSQRWASFFTYSYKALPLCTTAASWRHADHSVVA